MSRPLFSPDERKELTRMAEAGEVPNSGKGSVTIFDFKGKRLAIKRAWRVHPDMVRHVKAVKLVYNELRNIWQRRFWNVFSKPLYNARFFDLAAVKKGFAIYEYSQAPTLYHYMYDAERTREEQDRVYRAFKQLEKDYMKAIERARDKRKRVELKRDSGKGIVSPIFSDLTTGNVLFEGYDEKGRAKFILMDIVNEAV